MIQPVHLSGNVCSESWECEITQLSPLTLIVEFTSLSEHVREFGHQYIVQFKIRTRGGVAIVVSQTTLL